MPATKQQLLSYHLLVSMHDQLDRLIACSYPQHGGQELAGSLLLFSRMTWRTSQQC